VTRPYHIKIAPAAVRHIRELLPKHQKVVLKSIAALAINPRPPGVSRIEGMTGLYLQPVNHTRLVYKVEDQEVLILLVKS